MFSWEELSHFGSYDEIPNRTEVAGLILTFCNIPWISIVHPGAMDIDMSSSLHSLHYWGGPLWRDRFLLWFLDPKLVPTKITFFPFLEGAKSWENQ